MNGTTLTGTTRDEFMGTLLVALSGGFPEENGTPRMKPLPTNTAKREAYRERNIERAVDAYFDRDMSDKTLHKIGRSLHDVRVRDTLLREVLISGRGNEDLVLDYLTCVADRVHPLDAAPVLTLCAILEWMRGENLGMAYAFLIGAEHANPDYSLAILIRAALDAGMPADVWADEMAAIPYGVVRYGKE
jgi:hypothetical protein